MGNWDKPWMIGGGVEHGVEVARLMGHVAARGQEGVVSPLDLLVSQMETPAGQVRIARGSCAVINRTAGVVGETYLCRLPVQDTVAIAATGATARVDMVIVRVEDPFQVGNTWPVPAEGDLQTTDYVKVAVIPNVGTATRASQLNLGYPAIALATVEMPANKTEVLGTYIKDRRESFSAQSGIDRQIIRSTTARTLATSAWTAWPSDFVNLAVFNVPVWANFATISAVMGNIGMGSPGNNGGAGWQAVGNLRVSFRGGPSGASVSGPGSITGFDMDTDSGVDRSTMLTGVRRLPIPAEFRGRPGSVIVEAQRTSGTGIVAWDAKSLAMVDVAWIQDVG